MTPLNVQLKVPNDLDFTGNLTLCSGFIDCKECAFSEIHKHWQGPAFGSCYEKLLYVDDLKRKMGCPK